MEGEDDLSRNLLLYSPSCIPFFLLSCSASVFPVVRVDMVAFRPVYSPNPPDEGTDLFMSIDNVCSSFINRRRERTGK
jgi:hypothetical protein